MHAAPATLAVPARQGDDRIIARGERLARSGPHRPITRLGRDGDRVRCEDRWPAAADLGSLVIVPGGEVGRLLTWWTADDGSAWRWPVACSNHWASAGERRRRP